MTASPAARLRAIYSTIREAAPGISHEEAHAFLYVSEHEGACQRDAQDALGIPQSTASRVINRLNGRGFGLIHSEPDPTSRRRMNMHLTHKGRTLLAQLTVLLGCIMAFAPLALTEGDPELDTTPPPVTEPVSWDASGHDAVGRYDACRDLRTSYCGHT